MAEITIGDFFYSNVEILLPFEGTNGDTTTTDLSINDYSSSLVFNGVELSNEQSKFGTTSLKFDGVDGERITLPEAISTALGNASTLTIEAWVYLPSNPPNAPLSFLSESKPTTSGEQYLGFKPLDSDNNLTSGSAVTKYTISYFQHEAVDPVAPISNVTADDISFPPDTWAHVAWVYENQTVSLFINGVKSNYPTEQAQTQPATFWIPQSEPLDLGRRYNPAGLAFTIPPWGYLNDFRITIGIARYNSDFSVPTEPFAAFFAADSDQTLLIADSGGEILTATFTPPSLTAIDTILFVEQPPTRNKVIANKASTKKNTFFTRTQT